MELLHLSDEVLSARIEAALDTSIVAARTVLGGYTAAGRLLLELADGRHVFTKVGTTPETRRWLESEAIAYRAIDREFLPAFMAWIPDPERPMLILEDLSKAHWPPPWSAQQITMVVETLSRIAKTPPPTGLPSLEAQRKNLDGWVRVAADPTPFLSLGLCSRAWFTKGLPALLAAANAARLTGDQLVHLDIRSDNLCFHDGAVKIIDWNMACRGNAAVDLAAWLPSLQCEGGPPPHDLMADSQGLAALLSGYWASKAGLAPPAGTGPVRPLQLAQLKAALPWAARELGLPPPDGPAVNDRG